MKIEEDSESEDKDEEKDFLREAEQLLLSASALAAGVSLEQGGVAEFEANVPKQARDWYKVADVDVA